MNSNQDKVMTLEEAIARFVTDGCHISIGGFTVNRNPMAAVYEIIRQGRKISIAMPIRTVPASMS